jgi:hypothetical protein
LVTTTTRIRSPSARIKHHRASRQLLDRKPRRRDRAMPSPSANASGRACWPGCSARPTSAP